jgi:hypothetical protein
LTDAPDGRSPQEIAADVLRLQAKAAAIPTPDEVRELADQVVQRGTAAGMSLPEIRELADLAVHQADEIASLLRRLNTLLQPNGEH